MVLVNFTPAGQLTSGPPVFFKTMSDITEILKYAKKRADKKDLSHVKGYLIIGIFTIAAIIEIAWWGLTYL